MGAIKSDSITEIVVDLFCGGGGVSQGFHQAKNKFGENIAYVAVAVNHSSVAIKSHEANHPETLHFTEDIWLANVDEIAATVNAARLRFPNARVIVWMSAECTHFSKAKGGDSRDAKSRTLPESIFRYLIAINPDYLYVENVREFLSWGPLVPKVLNPKTGAYCPLKENQKTGKLHPIIVPESRTKGRFYMAWVRQIEKMGYHYDWKILNCANYGCYTSRERYFGIFAKHGLQINFPSPTHGPEKSRTGDLFNKVSNHLKPWKPVKEVLNLSDEGNSIFERDTPLVEATLERILAGLHKFVPKGDNVFLSKYFSGHPDSKNISVNEPAHAVTTKDHHSLIFMHSHYSNSKGSSLDSPSPTITTKDHHSLVFLQSYYGNGNCSSADNPSPTLTTHDRIGVVQAQWIDRNFSQGGFLNDIELPAGSITTVPKMNLVTAKFEAPRRAPWVMATNFKNVGSSIDEPLRTITADRHWHYIMNPQFSCAGHSVDQPSPTLIARMDKRPPSLVKVEQSGEISHAEIKADDSVATKKIKQFMQEHGINDIKMRMLNVLELKLITGFPEKYILKGSQANQKEMIGNAVPPDIVQAFAETLDAHIFELQQSAAA